MLESHLEAVGYEGLLDMAWGVKEETLLAQLMGTQDNRYNRTLIAHLELWRVQQWTPTYKFQEGLVKITEWGDEFMET